MPVAVFTLRFDQELARAVRAMWTALVTEGTDKAGPPSHRPHVTLAAYEAENVAPLCAALANFTRNIEPFSIRLSALGLFPETGTVFLAPHMNQVLLSTHTELLRYLFPICGETLHPEHLLSDTWMPHCTLASELAPDVVLHAVSACQKHWRPLSGLVEAIGLLVLPGKEDHFEARLTQVQGV
jgi:2'-5' RNA ligase